MDTSPTPTTGDAYARARAKQQDLSPAPTPIYQSWVGTLTPSEGTVMAQNPIVEKMALSGAVLRLRSAAHSMSKKEDTEVEIYTLAAEEAYKARKAAAEQAFDKRRHDVVASIYHLHPLKRDVLTYARKPPITSLKMKRAFKRAHTGTFMASLMPDNPARVMPSLRVVAAESAAATAAAEALSSTARPPSAPGLSAAAAAAQHAAVSQLLMGVTSTNRPSTSSGLTRPPPPATSPRPSTSSGLTRVRVAGGATAAAARTAAPAAPCAAAVAAAMAMAAPAAIVASADGVVATVPASARATVPASAHGGSSPRARSPSPPLTARVSPPRTRASAASAADSLLMGAHLSASGQPTFTLTHDLASASGRISPPRFTLRPMDTPRPSSGEAGRPSVHPAAAFSRFHPAGVQVTSGTLSAAPAAAKPRAAAVVPAAAAAVALSGRASCASGATDLVPGASFLGAIGDARTADQKSSAAARAMAMATAEAERAGVSEVDVIATPAQREARRLRQLRAKVRRLLPQAVRLAAQNAKYGGMGGATLKDLAKLARVAVELRKAAEALKQSELFADLGEMQLSMMASAGKRRRQQR